MPVTRPSVQDQRQADRRAVAELLGRRPQGGFEVVVRHNDGTPLVIRNAPLLDDGAPMPTRYWLVGEPERTWVSRLESGGGVRRAEAEVPAGEVAAAHRRYAAERAAALPKGHHGPAPSGGVGGTRQGLKCLHAHFAWWLAGGDDPVGAWVQQQLDEPRATAADARHEAAPGPQPGGEGSASDEPQATAAGGCQKGAP